jgi:maltose O-acetyltransferase
MTTEMRSEKDKMLAGEMYDANDPELFGARLKARGILKQYNESAADELDLRSKLLAQLIPESSEGVWIEPPFFCDYGTNIKLGRKVYMNFNCVILDVCRVTIGDNTFLAPSVQIYAATHPVNWKERSSGIEYGAPVTIGSDSWIGGGTVICPGVTIGSRTVIGAGSVVTRDIPDDVVAVGNPCRVIRKLDQD